MSKLAKFKPATVNANKHTQRGLKALEQSIREDGYVAPITVAADGEALDGSARMEVVADLLDVEPLIVEHDGTRPVVMVRKDIPNAQTDIAKRIAVRANRVGQIDLEWDAEVLAEMPADVLGELWTPEELSDLGAMWADAVEKPTGKPNPRNLPIDVIYTLQMADCTCCIAAQAGLRYGIQSAHYRLCPYTHELSGRHEVAFIDNDYFKYDHAVHLAAVRSLNPKYATVRDVMTEDQCNQAEIAYYSLEQILDWAEELSQYADNVIVIPKYDCLDQIPDKFMLGYSVPTSHGGTPMPVEVFRGRRVHLLGGSWKAQLAHMAVLGDDCVSLDTNYVQRQATLLGAAVRPDGEEFQCKEVGFDYLTNVRYAALALSFGAIGSAINQLYAGSANPAE